MLSLKNIKKHIQVFNLPCACTVAAPKEGCLCSHVEQRFTHELEDGTVGIRVTEKRLPGSLTLLAGEQRDGLPDWVANCPEVKGALALGALKLVKE